MKQVIVIILVLFIQQAVFSQDLIERTQLGIAPSNQQVSNRIAETIANQRLSNVFESIQVLNLNVNTDFTAYERSVDGAVYLTLNEKSLRELQTTAPTHLQFSIPVSERRMLELELSKVSILTQDFELATASGVAQEYDIPLAYRGVVNDDQNSMVSLSIFNDEIRLLIADEEGNYILGKLMDDSGNYILYNEYKLKVEIDEEWTCDTEDLPNSESSNLKESITQSLSNDCVNIYIEADYKIYQDQGSNINNVANYVFFIFNEIATQFALAGTNIKLSALAVWTVPDPYILLNSTSDILINFRDNTKSFNGDLAHFITSRSFGGIAYVDVLCGNIPHGMSGGLTSNNPANLPTTSSTFVRIAHELGHNLGLSHTHRCVWNGNNTQIDDCGNVWADEDNETPEGDACYNDMNPILPPSGGGTIMSYCHLRLNANGGNAIGRNLINGFTNQGNQIMQNTVANANCLAPSCESFSYKACTDFNESSAAGPGNLTIVNVTGNFPDLNNTNASVRVCVTTTGDVGNSSEVFNIFDESGNSRGQTNFSGQFDCGGTTAQVCFTATRNQYNTWRANGSISVSFDPVTNQINPSLCDFANQACVRVDVMPGSNLLDCSGTNLNVNSNNIASGDYVASNRVRSSGKINNGRVVLFQAGQIIELKSGFHARRGAQFTARIDNCSTASPNRVVGESLADQRLITQKAEIDIHPNPTSTTANIQFYLPKSGNVLLGIYNSTGQLLENLLEKSDLEEGTHSFNVSTEYYPKGMYFIVLQTSDIKITRKLVIIKTE